MKKALKLLVGIASVSSVFSAQAKELTFFFDVNSSGPEIYPCDAGIWQGNNAQFCHYKGTDTTCNPTNFGKTPDQVNPGQALKDYLGNTADSKSLAHACICTGANGGAYLMNFMRYNAATWTGGLTGGLNHQGWSGVTTKTANQPEEGKGVTVARDIRGTSAVSAKDIKQEFKTQLEAVTFSFGSELYGAHFFVDYCYRGPQIPYYTGQGQDANANFSTLLNVVSTNPFVTGAGQSTLDYTDLSGVNMKWEMVCDQQGKGDYKYDHNGKGATYDAGAGAFDQFDTDITDTGAVTLPPLLAVAGEYLQPYNNDFWVGNLGANSSEYKCEGSVSNSNLKTKTLQALLPSNNASCVNNGSFGKNWINNSNANTPRFCKLRTYFWENAKRNRERGWQRADARYIVKWAVEEGVEPTL